MSKLNNGKDYSETIGKFEHKLYKNMLHVLTQLDEWLPPYDSCSKLAAERLRKRIEQTKLDLVWEVRYSVHTPLGKRLLQLASKALQHAGWYTI